MFGRDHSLELWHEGTHLIAVEANDEAALAAGPVEIEERRLADVAHLPHTLHHPLPRYCFLYKMAPFSTIRITWVSISLQS